MKFDFIQTESNDYPVNLLCRVMQVSTSAYYDGSKQPSNVITAETLHLYRRIKQLFKKSRNSVGSREMVKALRKEGLQIGRYRVRALMSQLGLKVRQRLAYKVYWSNRTGLFDESETGWVFISHPCNP